MKKTVGKEAQLPPGGDRCGGIRVVPAPSSENTNTTLAGDEDVPQPTELREWQIIFLNTG